MPAMQENWVPSLGKKDPLEKGMTTHSSILVWRISMNRGALWAKVHRVAEWDTTGPMVALRHAHIYANVCI